MAGDSSRIYPEFLVPDRPPCCLLYTSAAYREARDFIGFELNSDYIDIANGRLAAKPEVAQVQMALI